MVLNLLKDMMNEGNYERIKKTMKDFLFFFHQINPRSLFEHMSRSSLLQISRDLMMIFQQETGDEQFEGQFLGLIEAIFHNSLVDAGQFEEFFHKLLPKIANDHVRDALLEIWFKNKLLQSAHKEIERLLREGKGCSYFGLPSFSLYSLSYGFGYNHIDDHFDCLLALFKNRKALMSKRYRGELLFILKFVDDICQKASRLLKMPLPSITDEDQIILEKNIKELNLDLGKFKASEINNSLLSLVSSSPTQESFSFILRFLKDNEGKFPME